MLVSRQYTSNINGQIAQKIVENKILNQRKALLSLRKYKDGIVMLDKRLESLVEPIDDLATLLGIEGTAAKIYFNRVFEEANWQGRQPRVKNDVINLLLDYNGPLVKTTS